MVNSEGGSSPLSLGSQHSVKIEKLAVGGSGIARIDNQVVFIPLTAPGDVALIEITLTKKNYAEGRLVSIEQPGPDRITPQCKYFGECGGCNWQHIKSTAQLSTKQSLVQETLMKFNKGLIFEMSSIVASPKSFRYRNRIQPQYNSQKVGFKKRSSHDLVDIDDCLLVEESLVKEWPQFKTQLKEQFAKLSDGAKELRAEIRLNQDLVIESSSTLTFDDNLGFSQVNRFQNSQIQALITQLVPENTEHTYDLYGGAGNFTSDLLQKQRSKKITLVEMSDVLAKKARSLFNPKKVTVLRSDVELYLKRTPIEPQSVVIIDPPRAGCSEFVMRTLARSNLKKLIYISCHPVSLARDIQILIKENPAASLGLVHTFEMFPQTDHVETVVEITFPNH